MAERILSFDEDNISVKDALLVVTAVLESLHRDNLHLQERIGVSLGEAQKCIIEDLQLLDRQAQVTLDLVTCLQRLAKTEPTATQNTPISKDDLFRLDATRHSVRREASRPSATTGPDPNEIWI